MSLESQIRIAQVAQIAYEEKRFVLEAELAKKQDELRRFDLKRPRPETVIRLYHELASRDRDLDATPDIPREAKYTLVWETSREMYSYPAPLGSLQDLPDNPNAHSIDFHWGKVADEKKKVPLVVKELPKAEYGEKYIPVPIENFPSSTRITIHANGRPFYNVPLIMEWQVDWDMDVKGDADGVTGYYYRRVRIGRPGCTHIILLLAMRQGKPVAMLEAMSLYYSKRRE